MGKLAKMESALNKHAMITEEGKRLNKDAKELDLWSSVGEFLGQIAGQYLFNDPTAKGFGSTLGRALGRNIATELSGIDINPDEYKVLKSQAIDVSESLDPLALETLLADAISGYKTYSSSSLIESNKGFSYMLTKLQIGASDPSDIAETITPLPDNQPMYDQNARPRFNPETGELISNLDSSVWNSYMDNTNRNSSLVEFKLG